LKIDIGMLLDPSKCGSLVLLVVDDDDGDDDDDDVVDDNDLVFLVVETNFDDLK
jgi:hypothetical protein